MPEMRSNNPFGKDFAARSYDKESGQNRVQNSGKGEEIREHDGAQEAEQFAEAAVPDDSVRKDTSVTRQTERRKPDQSRERASEATPFDVKPQRQVQPTYGSSGAQLLLALARHAVPAPITFEKSNEYIPDASNYMEAVYQMTHLLTDNQKLYELVPDYTSIALNLYYAHVYFYQVLRARDEIGILTRLQRRSLRIYNTIGKPESWPIATPLTGFIQALGAAESPDKMYSHVAPKLPGIDKFTSKKCLQGLKGVTGAGIVPIVPAYHEFLRLYATNKAHFDDDDLTFYPT